MSKKALFVEEHARLRVLSEFDIMDTSEEKEFNNLASLAAQICNVPIAQINFVDNTRTWTKASFGAPSGESFHEETFCSHTILESYELIVPDTFHDPRFKENKFVIGDPGVRFYAGINIKAGDNLNLGTLCVLDMKPRELTSEQIQALKILADEVKARLELRKNRIEQRTIANFLESSLDLMMIVDPKTLRIQRYSERVVSFFEVDQGVSNLSLREIFPDESFIESITEWDKNYSQENIKSLARVIGEDGDEWVFEVTVNKHHDKWFMAARNVSDLMIYQSRLEKLLYEKNVLISEVHHRVKNNLAVISSILQLEELKSESAEVQDTLYQNYMRIKSMSLIHDEMYKQSDFTGVQFEEYLNSFIHSLKYDKRVQNKDITFNLSMEPVVLNINQAVPCALIINELVSNALEFAFQGRDSGEVSIAFKNNGCSITLIVEDNGIGLPNNFDLENSPTLANTLIYSYTEQLDSKIKVSSDIGARFELTFQKNDHATGSSANHHFGKTG